MRYHIAKELDHSSKYLISNDLKKNLNTLQVTISSLLPLGMNFHEHPGQFCKQKDIHLHLVTHVSFNFFAINEICNILLKIQVSVAPSFFCGCSETVQALHADIMTGSI